MKPSKVWLVIALVLCSTAAIAHEAKKYLLKIGDQSVVIESHEAVELTPLDAPPPPPPPPPHDDHQSSTEVTDTHVVTHHDRIPRFGANAEAMAVKSGLWSDASTWSKPPAAGDRVQIPAGLHVTYDRKSTANMGCIEIAGCLAFSDQADTELWTTDIMVLPSGCLEVETERRVEVVFVDGKLDAGEAGHGLLVFGEISVQGQAVKPFSRLAGDVEAGATMVNLRDAVDWPVGSTIVFPDTRQINPVSNKYRAYQSQQEIRTVAAVEGNVVSFSPPLAFNHRAPTNMDGTPTVGFDGVPLAPHVAVLSRNVVFRSENPEGVRGHVQLFGDASVSIRHAEFRDLGRTKPGPLGEANRVGRYSLHAHHLVGRPGGIDGHQFVIEGNSIVGALKWGITIHGSHYGLIRGNVVYDVDGAGIATENGAEIGNVFESNFVCKVGTEETPKPWNGLGEQTENDLGDQGDGFWFPGPMNTVRNNVVANAQRSAYTVWPDGMPHSPDSRSIRPVVSPVEPLGELKLFNLLDEPFDDFSGNEAYGATTSAIQLWSVGSKGGNLLKDTTAWHVTGVGVRFYYSDGCKVDGWLQRGDPTMIGVDATQGGPDYPSRGEAVTHSGSLARWSEVCRADIQGCQYGYIQRGHGFTNTVELCDAILDNPTNLEILNWAQQPSDTVYRNVRFLDSYSPGSLRAIRMSWEPFSPENAVTPETHTLVDFQGIKNLDLDLFFYEQAPGAKAPMVPEGGTPKGRFAPVEQDGDQGEAARARGKAMGIDGLVFVLSHPAEPVLFWNVLLENNRPTLHYAVIGGEPEVEVTFQGKMTKLKGATGSLPLVAPDGLYPLELTSGAVTVSKNVRLPVK